jgi:hypothetical protein
MEVSKPGFEHGIKEDLMRARINERKTTERIRI